MITLLALLITASYAAADPSLHLVKLQAPALCLDGTPGAYYISKDGDPKKIFLQFQGGGWCYSSVDMASSLESCYQRSKNDLGSSLNYSQTVTAGDGMLSINDQNNFKDWTRVFLKYCDGSGHQGTRQKPIAYKNTSLYFRGHNVTVAQLESLEKNNKLFSEATDVVVSGGSAGGLAVFLWTNYIKQRVKVGKVWAIPDSGIFLDAKNAKTGNLTYKTSFRNLMKITNVEIDPPTPECVKKFPNEIQNCMFAQNLYQYIKVPLFPIQSLYDTWSIHYIIGIACIQNLSLINCTKQQMTYIEEYHKGLVTVLTGISQNNKQNGYWAPVCAYHVLGLGGGYYSPNYRIPQHSQNSLCASVKNWIESGSSQNSKHIDSGVWPDNLPCAGPTKVQLKTN